MYGVAAAAHPFPQGLLETRQSESGGEFHQQDLIRVAYQRLSEGLIEKNAWKSPDEMERLATNLKDRISQRAYQISVYENDDPSLFLVDYNDFGQENEINGFELEALIRYLILKDEVFSYCRARASFCLFMNCEAHENRDTEICLRCRTKQNLLAADAAVETLVFPSWDIGNNENNKLVGNICRRITNELYRRALYQEAQSDCCNLCVFLSSDSSISDYMDKLVTQGLIHSWNVLKRNNTIHVKLKANDRIKESSVFAWDNWP